MKHVHVPIPHGTVFGRLTVLRREHRDPRVGVRYLARCSCGVRVVKRASQMRNGETKSCGCLQRERNPRLPEAMCFRSVVLDQFSTRTPRSRAEVMSLVEADYGSFVERRLWRALAWHRSQGNLVRVDGGYLRARSS